MHKIPTLFVRDETVPGHPVLDSWRPECLWVREGEGNATIKIDGTNVCIRGGRLYKRQKPKDRDYDAASYVVCVEECSADRWAFEAFNRLPEPEEGVYELIGPAIQGNPYRQAAHHLKRVVPPDPLIVIGDRLVRDRTYEKLRAYLTLASIEGVVFQHSDGRFAKIKRRDFGLPWPPAVTSLRCPRCEFLNQRSITNGMQSPCYKELIEWWVCVKCQFQWSREARK